MTTYTYVATGRRREVESKATSRRRARTSVRQQLLARTSQVEQHQARRNRSCRSRCRRNACNRPRSCTSRARSPRSCAPASRSPTPSRWCATAPTTSAGEQIARPDARADQGRRALLRHGGRARAVFPPYYLGHHALGRAHGPPRQRARAALRATWSATSTPTSKIKCARCMYPAVIALLSIGDSRVMATFVLPKFVKFFKQLHAKLPLPTRMLHRRGRLLQELLVRDATRVSSPSWRFFAVDAPFRTGACVP